MIRWMHLKKRFQVDYTKYDEDSVPESEKVRPGFIVRSEPASRLAEPLPKRRLQEIKHTHPGRPDLDYDDTPVGPAPGTVSAGL